MNKLVKFTNNHLIYFNIYAKLKPREILRLYFSSDIFRKSIIEYVSVKFKPDDWYNISNNPWVV